MERNAEERQDGMRRRARGSAGRSARAERPGVLDDGRGDSRGAGAGNAGLAVLQNTYVRRYLGEFIHAATRDDLRSRVAIHSAIPAFTSDLSQLFDVREAQFSALMQAAAPLARRVHSRDVTAIEQDRLSDAWSALLDNAPTRFAAVAAARRQIDVWRIIDALPSLASALPQRGLFREGIVRASDIAAALAARVCERNALRLRELADALSDTDDPPQPARQATLCDALADVLAAVYRVDLTHSPSAERLAHLLAEWAHNGWLASLSGALPLAIGPQGGGGFAGIVQLGEGLGSRYRYAKKMARAEEVNEAAWLFESVGSDTPLVEQHRFRMIYALHDALRDDEDRPSATIDAITAQFEVWRLAGWLPLLSAATLYDYFYLDGRLRLSDIDAHFSREFALMRTLPRGIRRGFYEAVYDDVPTDDEGAQGVPSLASGGEGESAMHALSAYIDGRSIENQFRILQTILLRETTDPVARTYLIRGIEALRHSPLLTMFDAGFAAGWYETLLLDPVIAPFNTAYIAVLHELLALGVDIEGFSPEWVGSLHVSPQTFLRLWQQRDAFRFLSACYHIGLTVLGDNATPEIGVDAYLMFASGIGDRRARAFSRWVDYTVPGAIAALTPMRVREWVHLLLDGSISDAAIDAWLAGVDYQTFAVGLPCPDETRRTLLQFDAARPLGPCTGQPAAST